MSNKSKGKKINHDFVIDFIEDRISDGKKTSDEIVEEAKKRVLAIEKKISKINKLKIERANLLSVIESFEQ